MGLFTMRVTACLAALFGASTLVCAQPAYPSRPIALIVPFAAGGNNDVSGRILAQKLGELLGQSIVVENRTGAGGAIGAAAVASARPDGYTLGFLSSGPLAANVSLTRSLAYDPRKDFAPIARVTTSPSVLVVAASSPQRTLEQFIAEARARPGAINYGTAGTGSSSHLAGALFDSLAATRMVPVAYRGGLLAINDLLAGQVQAVFAPILEVMPQVQAGTLRALAVTTVGRSALLPEVPTIAERLTGYEILTWNGVVAPAGTPPEIVERVLGAVKTALADPQVVAKLRELGLEVALAPPAEFGNYIDRQIRVFADLTKIAGVEPN